LRFLSCVLCSNSSASTPFGSLAVQRRRPRAASSASVASFGRLDVACSARSGVSERATTLAAASRGRTRSSTPCSINHTTKPKLERRECCGSQVGRRKYGAKHFACAEVPATPAGFVETAFDADSRPFLNVAGEVQNSVWTDVAGVRVDGGRFAT